MKKIVVTGIIVLVTALAVMLGIKYTSDKQAKLHMAQESERMTYLLAQRHVLNKQIEDAKEEYDVIMNGDGAYFVLFYDNMEANLIDVIYPLISADKYAYRGTVVMSDMKLPGDEGLITMNDYRTLEDEGWDFAMGTGSLDLTGDNSVEVLRGYIEEYKAALAEKEIAIPATFCFNEGQYSEAYDSLLIEEGFKVIRLYGENGEKFSAGMARNGLYYLNCGVICSDATNMKADIEQAHSAKRTYSSSVRYVQNTAVDIKKDCGRSKYVQMLDYLAGYCPDTTVLTASELYEQKAKTLNACADFLESFNEKMSTMEKSLEDTNNEIKAIVE